MLVQYVDRLSLGSAVSCSMAGDLLKSMKGLVIRVQQYGSDAWCLKERGGNFMKNGKINVESNM